MRGEVRADGLAAIQIDARARDDLAVDGARHDIARRQFGILVDAGHEALAAPVHQHRAFAAQCFGGQRRGIAAHRDGGGMELHEFRIGDHRAGARRHAQALAARFQRIGGDAIKRAQPARRQNHGAGAEQDQPRIAADAGAGEEAGDPAILHRQFHGMEAFQQGDAAGFMGARGKRRGNRRAGAIALHMHDAGQGMRRLAAHSQGAVGVAVERRAECHQVVDAGRGFLGHQVHNARVAQARARRHGVTGMALPAVAFAHGGGNAALCPGAGAGQARPRPPPARYRAWEPASGP